MTRAWTGIDRISLLLLTISALAIGDLLPAAFAQNLTVPVMEHAEGDLDTCGLGEVTGLNPAGDNFLAVRTGPGSKYKMIDKLHTGDRVWMFDYKGEWIGVVYGSDSIECSPIRKDRPYAGPGRKGWVHKKFVRLLAG
jgi:hypothetical protein